MSRPGVSIYTDGAASNQSGFGGWAAILISGKHKKELSGQLESTTSQRAELIAAINALYNLKRSSTVTLYSDSQYLVNAFEKGWISRWVHNGWKSGEGKPIKNRDLWETLLALCDMHNVQFVHVKGHNGDHYNESCDRLAKKAAREATRASREMGGKDAKPAPDLNNPTITEALNNLPNIDSR